MSAWRRFGFGQWAQGPLVRLDDLLRSGVTVAGAGPSSPGGAAGGHPGSGGQSDAGQGARPAPAVGSSGAPAGGPPVGGADEGESWHRLARVSFRQWRRTRPFWAGLLCLIGGALMAYGPLSVFRYVLVAGTVIWPGILMGLLVCAMGLFMWFTPQFRQIVGVLAAIFSVISLVTSNLGGFVIGMLLGSLGGAMGFAWTSLPVQGSAEPARPASPPGDGEPEPGRGGRPGEHGAARSDPGTPARTAPATVPLPVGAVPRS